MNSARLAASCLSRPLAIVLSAVLCLGSIHVTARAGESTDERIVWHTGRRLDQQLQRPVNIALNRTTPRQVVLRLRELHEIALLLDRRVDPDQTIDVQFTQMTLENALRVFAVQLESELVRVGGTLLIGPSRSTDRTRTLIALRTGELRNIDGEDAVGRQFELLRGTTLVWDDIAEPVSVVDEVCEAFHVKRTGASVPHDLWAAGVLADVNAIEALCLLLGQFDLTFEWQQSASAIQFVPVPESVTIEQQHTPRRIEMPDAIQQIRDEFPHLDPQVSGRTVTVAATAGEHDAIAALLAPERSRPSTIEPTQGPLSRRRFTLKATRAEAIAILRTLQDQDVTIEYDVDELQQAGIDLRQAVSLQLEQATAVELFTQLCEPLGLRFEIENKSVRLSPRP